MTSVDARVVEPGSPWDLRGKTSKNKRTIRLEDLIADALNKLPVTP